MPPRNWTLRISDMHGALAAIEKYTKQMSHTRFLKDDKTGEAARHIPEEIQSAHPEIPWKEIRGMHHFLVHEYFDADRDLLWSTIRDDLPLLRKNLNNLKKLL